MTEFTVKDVEDRIYEILCRAATGEEIILRHGGKRLIMLPVRPEDGPMFKALMEDAKAMFGEAFSYERMLDVSTVAEVIAQNFPSRPAAYWWIRTAALAHFEGQTPLQVLMEGRYDVLLRHLRNMMTLEALDDVDARQLVGQHDVEAWLRDVVIPAYEAYRAPGFTSVPEDQAETAPRGGPADADFTPEELEEFDQREAGKEPKFKTLEEVRAALYDRRDEDLLGRLNEPLTLRAFTGARSAVAALEACKVLMSGDVAATIKWMNHRLSRRDTTPLELAEQGGEGLRMVLDHIARIDAGVYF